jgi:hypothetical protein
MSLYFSGCQLLQHFDLVWIKAMYGWNVKVCVVQLHETSLLTDQCWRNYVSLLLKATFQHVPAYKLPPLMIVVKGTEDGWQEKVRSFIDEHIEGGFDVAKREFERNRTSGRIDKTGKNVVVVLGSIVFPGEQAYHSKLIQEILGEPFE